MPARLDELAEALGAELHGDAHAQVHGIAPLSSAGPGQLSFLAHSRHRRHLAATRASAVILTADALPDCPVAALVCDHPYLAYAKAAALLHPPQLPVAGIHPTAVVSPAARLDVSVAVAAHCVVEAGCHLEAGVSLGPGCVIERDCELGADTRLSARVTLGHGVRLGRRCLVHPGAVIGADGFGFAPEDGRWVKIPQLGSVHVGDDVEIGANTTIDRGALEDTVIEDGVKLDNLIQVAHNVRIGAHTAIAGCVGIAGSTEIGRHCAIGGGAGILGHLRIVDGVTITAMSLVTRSITRPGTYSSGVPHQTSRDWNRSLANLRRLDDMARRLRRLEHDR